MAGKISALTAQTTDTCEDCVAGKTSVSPFTACVAVPSADAPSKSPNNVTTDKDILRPNGRNSVVVIMATVAVVGAMVTVGLFVYSCCLKPEATLETKAPETSV